MCPNPVFAMVQVAGKMNLRMSFRADGVGGVGVGGVEGLEEDRDDSDENSPSFLLVLTAAGGAYKREDGVYVAPVNLLKP